MSIFKDQTNILKTSKFDQAFDNFLFKKYVNHSKEQKKDI